MLNKKKNLSFGTSPCASNISSKSCRWKDEGALAVAPKAAALRSTLVLWLFHGHGLTKLSERKEKSNFYSKSIRNQSENLSIPFHSFQFLAVSERLQGQERLAHGSTPQAGPLFAGWSLAEASERFQSNLNTI